MDAGKLNKRVAIRRFTATRDPVYNTEVKAWADLATVWAEVQDILPSRAERVADSVNIAKRPCRVRMRYRSDITTQHRLRIAGREYRIVSGPAELGNREGIELMAEALTTEGSDI